MILAVTQPNDPAIEASPILRLLQDLRRLQAVLASEGRQSQALGTAGRRRAGMLFGAARAAAELRERLHADPSAIDEAQRFIGQWRR